MSTTSTMFANSDTKSQSSTKDKSSKSDVAHGLRSLFLDGLKDIYYAENALTKAIPKMISNATDAHLVKALTGHLEETKLHVTRL